MTFALPRLPDEQAMERLPVISFTSGYVQRALAFLPKQGARQPGSSRRIT